MGRIRNGLERALNWGKAAIISLPLLVGPYGCKPEENPPPQLTLEVNPKEGYSPFNSSVKIYGTDEWGIDDIKKYKATLDGRKLRDANYPLDTIIKFVNDGQSDEYHELVAEIVDSEGQVSKKYARIKVSPARINRFVQPKDSTKNWYGSGDIDNNNKSATKEDLDLLVRVISGEYKNPNDRRLNDRSDVNGDRNVNNRDLELLAKKSNGTILYLPGEWNLLMTPQERKDWFTKMLAIDKTDEIPPTPEFNCDEHVYQLIMNFNGFKSEDLKKFLEVNLRYDTTNNRRFNIPVDFAAIYFYDSDGNMISPGHAIGTVTLGDDYINIGDKCLFETETDAIDVNISEDYKPSDNQRVFIRGPPILFGYSNGEKALGLTYYFDYYLKNNIPTLHFVNQEIELVTERPK
jgi:hypothetical protein